MPTVLKYEKNMTITLKVAAAATITEGQEVGVDSSGNAVLAVNTGGAVIQALGVAVKGGAGSKGDYVAVAPVAECGGFTGLTPGGTVYLGGTAGGVTQTRPTVATTAIQPIGQAISATKIAFVHSPQFVLAQASGSTTLG